MKNISELNINDHFKTSVNSCLYVVIDKKDGKIGYRHLITDFPNKVAYYINPETLVIPA